MIASDLSGYHLIFREIDCLVNYPMATSGRAGGETDTGFEKQDDATKARSQRKPLPLGYEPSSWSVICARGREAYDHIGNRRLRVLVENNLDNYERETSKFGKSMIVNTIIESVRESCRGGGSFVKKEPRSGGWVEIGDDAAREKIGQMLRESLIRRCPRKLEAKKEKRRAKAKQARRESADEIKSVAPVTAVYPIPRSEVASSSSSSAPAPFSTEAFNRFVEAATLRLDSTEEHILRNSIQADIRYLFPERLQHNTLAREAQLEPLPLLNQQECTDTDDLRPIALPWMDFNNSNSNSISNSDNINNSNSNNSQQPWFLLGKYKADCG